MKKRIITIACLVAVCASLLAINPLRIIIDKRRDMKRKTIVILSVTSVLAILLIALIFRYPSNENDVYYFSTTTADAENHTVKADISLTDTVTVKTHNTLECKVVGLVSDGGAGSKAVCFNTETWDYIVLMELPEVTPDNFAAISSNNKMLAYTTWDDYYTRRYLKVVDIETNETTVFFKDIPPRTEIIKISWMPDNETLLYIRNNTQISSYQTIELMNIYNGKITVVTKGEVWRIRTGTDLGQRDEDFFQPGSETYIPVKYTEQISEDVPEQWNYYLDLDDLRHIYERYGGVRAFDFNTIMNLMCVEFSAPRCSVDGKSIIYSAKLERDSAPGERTPLWVAAAIWLYDLDSQTAEIIYKQKDEGSIGRVDWVGKSEACFVSYYDFQGSRDDINYLNIETKESRILFPHTDEYYNNVTLLPVGTGKVSFTSSAKDHVYSDSKTYVMDVHTGIFEELAVVYDEMPIILEKFICIDAQD